MTGISHHRTNLPCQDAVAWRSKPRPILALADGAGSAVVSERGALALVDGMSRFLESLEEDVAGWLDSPHQANANLDATNAHWSRRLLAHAKGLLVDLSRAERRDVRDFRSTLLLAVLGTERIFWWQLGDGTIAVRNEGSLRTLGDIACAKGEFANQTLFVDIARVEDVQYGTLSTHTVSGIALMSDGGAEKLVARDGSAVAARLGIWLDAVAENRLHAGEISVAYHDPKMWERTTLDDRAVVLCARPTGHQETELLRMK